MRTFKKVLSVALVLAMAVSCFALTSLAEGNATYGDWIKVDGATVGIENWYDPVEDKNASYEYRLGTDGENLYFSFRTTDSLERGTLGNDLFRVWFRDDATATIYTDFVTVKYENDDFSIANAKYNTSTTENKGADWSAEDIEKINLSSSEDGDYTTVEISFPFSILDKAGESVDVWVSYWPYFLENAVGTTCLHSGETGVWNEETQKVDTSKLPYTTWNADDDANLVIAVPDDGSDEDPVVEADFGWDIVIPEGEAGDEIDVTITLKGLAEDKSILMVSMFVTHSDNLVPVVTEPTNVEDPFFTDFGTKTPNGWESAGGQYSAEDNAYYLCFMGAANAAEADGDIVLTIPFKIADDAKDGDELKVSVNYDEGLAEKFDITIENMDGDVKPLNAGTADATTKVGLTDTSSDVSSDVSSSASSAPADSSSTPSTSDVGIAAIIVLAVAAVIGAAVIIRKRA